MTPEEEFKKIAKAIKRPGINELLGYLEATDFFNAPASTKYHGAHKGGLVLHCLSVYDTIQHMNEYFDLQIANTKLVTCALFHDICKANFYIREKRNKKIDGAWHEVEVWSVKDQFPMGYGEKSLYLIQKFIPLDDDEALAIRWHMGGSDPGVHFNYPSGAPSSQAFRQHKLVALLSSADLAASYLMEDWTEG